MLIIKRENIQWSAQKGYEAFCKSLCAQRYHRMEPMEPWHILDDCVKDAWVDVADKMLDSVERGLQIENDQKTFKNCSLWYRMKKNYSDNRLLFWTFVAFYLGLQLFSILLHNMMAVQ